jgi:hypothetical protein
VDYSWRRGNEQTVGGMRLDLASRDPGANGPVLRYGPGHEEDRYGGLRQARLDDFDEDWNGRGIARDAFERVWNPASE